MSSAAMLSEPQTVPAQVSIPLEVKIESSFADLENLREVWDETVIALDGSVYLSFDWCKTWWNFYGKNKSLRIFLFYLEGKLRAILPLYIDRIGLKPLQLSVARLVGANIPPKAFKPAIPTKLAETVFRSIFRHLFEQDWCDLLSLGPLPSDTNLTAAVQSAALKEPNTVGLIRVLSQGVSSVFPLPQSLDDFFEGLDKDERKKRKYELRLLRKQPGVREDVVSNPQRLEEEFEKFARLHAQQWTQKGKLGHFGSWPRGLEFHRALVKVMGANGRTRFVRILAGDEIVSCQYGFAFGDSFFWELPARVVDAKWQRFSLGPAGFFDVVETAIKEGKKRIEGGLAHYDYKQKLNAIEYETQIVRVTNRRASARARMFLFRGVRSVVLWVYYKVWYSRLSPRLAQPFRKPLWNFWLRLDF